METRDRARFDWIALDTNQERVSGLTHSADAFDFNSVRRP